MIFRRQFGVFVPALGTLAQRAPADGSPHSGYSNITIMDRTRMTPARLIPIYRDPPVETRHGGGPQQTQQA